MNIAVEGCITVDKRIIKNNRGAVRFFVIEIDSGVIFFIIEGVLLSNSMSFFIWIYFTNEFRYHWLA